jgi:hypothetical protein
VLAGFGALFLVEFAVAVGVKFLDHPLAHFLALWTIALFFFRGLVGRDECRQR